MTRRIGITTTPDRGRELAANAVARSCEPILLPCIEVFAYPDDVLDGARAIAAHAGGLIITSPRTVSALWPDGSMPGVPVAAVGSRTAEMVETAGGTVVLVGDTGVDALIAELPEDWAGVEIFFPHGEAGDTATVPSAGVTAMAVYGTRTVAPRDEPVDAVVFGSPSAVAGWVLSRDLDDIVLGAIGPTTADALVELGHPPHIVPDRPGYEVLIDLVADNLLDRSVV